MKLPGGGQGFITVHMVTYPGYGTLIKEYRLVKLLRTPLIWALAALAALAAPLAAIAAEPKPVAVVSLASVDETLADIGYITSVTGMEDAGKMVRLFGAALTSGMDKKRPAGAFVVPLAGEFPTIA